MGTLYRRGSGTGWSDSNSWSYSSGGPADVGRIPGLYDNVIFDTNSSYTEVSSNQLCNTINTTDSSATISISGALFVTASSTIDTSLFSGSGVLKLYGAVFTGTATSVNVYLNSGTYSGTLIGDNTNTLTLNADASNLAVVNMAIVEYDSEILRIIKSLQLGASGGTCSAAINESITINGGDTLVFSEDLLYYGTDTGCNISHVTITGSDASAGNKIYALGAGVVDGGGNTNWEVNPYMRLQNNNGVIEIGLSQSGNYYYQCRRIIHRPTWT